MSTVCQRNFNKGVVRVGHTIWFGAVFRPYPLISFYYLAVYDNYEALTIHEIFCCVVDRNLATMHI